MSRRAAAATAEPKRATEIGALSPLDLARRAAKTAAEYGFTIEIHDWDTNSRIRVWDPGRASRPLVLSLEWMREPDADQIARIGHFASDIVDGLGAEAAEVAYQSRAAARATIAQAFDALAAAVGKPGKGKAHTPTQRHAARVAKKKRRARAAG